MTELDSIVASSLSVGPVELLTSLASDVGRINANPSSIEKELRRTKANYALLMQLRQDLRREEMYGCETLYCLDFSEIHGYMHPMGRTRKVGPSEIAQVEMSVVAEVVFERTTCGTTMPVATLHELLNHLDYLASELRRRSRAIGETWVPALRSEEAQNFKKALNDFRGDFESVRAAYVNLVQKWPTFADLGIRLPSSPDISAALDRLDAILDHGYRSLHSLVPPHEVDADHFAFRQSLEFLAPRRPDKAVRNRIDALNIAVTYFLDTYFYEQHRQKRQRNGKYPYFVLLTRGWPTGIPLSLPFDPIRSEPTLERAGIVRDLQYALYRSLLDEAIQDPVTRVEFCIAAVQFLSMKMMWLEECLVRPGIKSLKPSWDEFQANHPATALELVVFQQFHSRVQRQFMNVSDRIKRVAESFDNTKARADLKSLTPESWYFLDSDAVADDRIRHRTSQLSERLARIRLKISDQLGTLKESSAHYYPVTQTQSAQDFQVKEISEHLWEVRIRPSQDVLCKSECKPFTYEVFCEAWPARLTWFSRVMTYLYATASELDSRENLRRVAKHFEGVRVNTTKDEEWEKWPLAECLYASEEGDIRSLNLDEIWKEVAKDCDGIPKRIEVCTPYMDVWYDFLSPDLKTATIGIRCHVALPHQVAYLVARSQKRMVVVETLEKVFAKRLMKRYPWHEEDFVKSLSEPQKAATRETILKSWHDDAAARTAGLRFGQTDLYDEAYDSYKQIVRTNYGESPPGGQP